MSSFHESNGDFPQKHREENQRVIMLQRTRRRCEGTAMGAIVLDLRPGLGVGPFTLGNSRSVSEFSFYMIELIEDFVLDRNLDWISS